MSLSESNQVLIPENLRQLIIYSPFRTGIRECSKVLVENENGSISEINVEDHWYPTRDMSKRQRKMLKNSDKLKMYAPKFDKRTNEVYFEYVLETEDFETADKMVDDAWNLLNGEQARRESQLTEWLERNNLKMLSTMYACHK